MLPAASATQVRRRFTRRHGQLVFGALYPYVHAPAPSCLTRLCAPLPAFASSLRVFAPIERTITAPPHACNRHSVTRHRQVRRGFLPRGLFNTCPPFRGITSSVCRAGRCRTNLNGSCHWGAFSGWRLSAPKPATQDCPSIADLQPFSLSSGESGRNGDRRKLQVMHELAKYQKCCSECGVGWNSRAGGWPSERESRQQFKGPFHSVKSKNQL